MEEVPRRTSLVPLAFPLVSTLFNRGGNKERFRLPGAGGGSFPLYGGTFSRSYSVSIIVRLHSTCFENLKCNDFLAHGAGSV